MYNLGLTWSLSLLCLAAAAQQTPPVVFEATPTLARRQDDMETRTFGPLTSSVELQPAGLAQTASPTTTYRLETASPPLQIADTIGLIMPNPWSKLYVGLPYSLGFVDVIPRPAPTVGGWLRQIQPLLMLPNYRIDIFPSSGTGDVGDDKAVPPGSDGLCGFTVEDYAISYPFVFEQPGWYMWILNQTLLKPSVSQDHTCQDPIISQDTFFATQSFSVGPAPTDNMAGFASPSAYTVFADVSVQTPGSLPFDPQAMTASERLGVGLGVTAGVLAVIAAVGAIWWLRRKRRYESEMTAFNRLSEADRAAFLAENPDSWLNPNKPDRRRQNVYTDRPPAPPGTMAYTQWYWTHLMRNQPRNPGWDQQGGYQPYGPVPAPGSGRPMQRGPMPMGQVSYNHSLPPLPSHA